jgi:hypothetical protein
MIQDMDNQNVKETFKKFQDKKKGTWKSKRRNKGNHRSIV